MKRIVVILLGSWVMNCAVQKATINTYVDPNFSQGEINSLAVFPIRNSSAAPSEAKQINRKISISMKDQNPNIQIISAAEATRLLNENDLADDWGYFLDNYASSGIADANVLVQIGEVLGVDGILQGEVVNVFQEDGYFGGNKGTTRVTVRFTMLDTRKGKMVWESSSDGIKKTATTVETAPPIIEAINLAVNKILASIPRLTGDTIKRQISRPKRTAAENERAETQIDMSNDLPGDIVGEITKLVGKYAAVKVTSDSPIQESDLLEVYNSDIIINPNSSKTCTAEVIAVSQNGIAIRILGTDNKDIFEVGQLVLKLKNN